MKLIPLGPKINVIHLVMVLKIQIKLKIINFSTNIKPSIWFNLNYFVNTT